MSEQTTERREPLIGHSAFRQKIRGRFGEFVYRSVEGKVVAVHQPKQKRTRPPTERELAHAALQKRLSEAYDALAPGDLARWEAYAFSLRKRKKKSEGSGWKLPNPKNLFKKAMGERWRNDPNAPVMRNPFEPALPVWHGDGI